MILLMPTAILLAVSFFVLVTVAKIEAKSLKIFGWAISIFLWISAALIMAAAVTTMAPCSCCKTGAMMGSCQLMGKGDTYADPHHPWMNNPHKGMMMDDMPMEDMPMGGKCTGMGDMMKDMPEKK